MDDLIQLGELTEKGWGESEKPLEPPVTLLKWIVSNLSELENTPVLGEKPTDTKEKRQALIRGDENVVREALRLLDRGARGSEWYVLEGLSKPDVYLETERALVVIEGKRTEHGPTTHTTWMPVRHQMLRHIDGAWEKRGARSVYGFFIVEDDGAGQLPAAWVQYAKATVSQDALDKSLPHRTTEERAAIANAFLGVTTWQAVCAAFDIDTGVMLDKV